ncbi:MAG: hypothetical protein WBS20_16055, partial [Lysobacterales bacterium]
MSFWKNRHVLVATLVAPVLGLASYFGMGAIFGEKPHPAEAGRTYHLIEKPNCRYSSSICGLKNVDFELTLSGEPLPNDRYALQLVSENPLDGVKLALVENAAEPVENATDESKPVDMKPLGTDGLTWSLEIKRPDPLHDRLRLVASARQTL